MCKGKKSKTVPDSGLTKDDLEAPADFVKGLNQKKWKSFFKRILRLFVIVLRKSKSRLPNSNRKNLFGQNASTSEIPSFTITEEIINNFVVIHLVASEIPDNLQFRDGIYNDFVVIYLPQEKDDFLTEQTIKLKDDDVLFWRSFEDTRTASGIMYKRNANQREFNAELLSESFLPEQFQFENESFSWSFIDFNTISKKVRETFTDQAVAEKTHELQDGLFLSWSFKDPKSESQIMCRTSADQEKIISGSTNENFLPEQELRLNDDQMWFSWSFEDFKTESEEREETASDKVKVTTEMANGRAQLLWRDDDSFFELGRWRENVKQLNDYLKNSYV